MIQLKSNIARNRAEKWCKKMSKTSNMSSVEKDKLTEEAKAKRGSQFRNLQNQVPHHAVMAASERELSFLNHWRRIGSAEQPQRAEEHLIRARRRSAITARPP
ncbi:unnamed protein product [Lepidochelys kempii]